MSSIPLPALGLRPPESPVEQMGKVIQLKSMLQNQKLQQQTMQENEIDIKQKQKDQQDQQILQQQLQASPGSTLHDILPSLSGKIGANAWLKLKKADDDIQDNYRKKTKEELENAAAQHQQYQSVYDNIMNMPDEQVTANWPQIAQAINSVPGGKLQLDPQQPKTKQELQQFAPLLSLNDAYLKAEVAKRTAKAEAKIKENESGPLPVDQLNKGMSDRYQVLNPGQPLPPEFTLSPTSTAKDFDRIDKLLSATESAKGTQAQRETANAIRQQTLGMAQQAAQDRQDKEGLQSVIGTDPKTGKSVLVPMSQAKSMGVENPMKAGEAEVGKAQAARHWIPLAEKQGSTPEEMGILPLIDKLDKEGKLGTVASRWNDFMAGKVGAGDPEFSALRTKMGLSTTLLMNAHVGNRGGAYMLEHFEDMANAGKMDAATLKSGVKSELDYIKDRAMLPGQSKASEAKGQPDGATHTGIGSVDKKKHWLDAQGKDLGVAE